MTATLLLMGHGSQDPEGAGEFFRLVDAVREALPGRLVTAGVLEFPGPEAPSIREAFDRCAATDVHAVRAVPVLLSRAVHAKQDMPLQVAEARARHPELEITLCPPLGIDPLLLEIVEERISELSEGLDGFDPRETAVLLVARGATDAEANADMFKVARLLWERNAFPWVEPCFVSLAHPFVPEGIQRCVALGAKTVLVLPYFINTGKLVHRIGLQAAATRRDLPASRIAVGTHLGVHPKLVRMIVERAGARRPGGACLNTLGRSAAACRPPLPPLSHQGRGDDQASSPLVGAVLSPPKGED